MQIGNCVGKRHHFPSIISTSAARTRRRTSAAERGAVSYPEVNIGLWSGVFVLAGTPPAIIKKLEAELQRAMADPGVREKLKAMAVNPGGGPPDAFHKRIESNITLFADVIKAANLKFED
jgi:tripartite-type tricarboxylate transporter receptor subunit TctC